MVSYVTSATSNVVGFISNNLVAPVLALKTSQSAVISTIAKAVLNKYAAALALASIALYSARSVTFTNLKADFTNKEIGKLFWTLVKPLAIGGAAAFVAVVL